MGGARRSLIGWTVVAGVMFTCALTVVPDAPAAITIEDPVGDSTAAAGPACSSGCPDISAVHVSEADGAIVVEVQSASPWGSKHAEVRLSGQAPFAQVGVRMTSDFYPGPPPFERVLADPTRYVFRLDPGTAFMRNFPLELRVQAAAVSHTAPFGSPPGTTYDMAPDAGEATYPLDNRDGDSVPDIGDPCPDATETAPPSWVDSSNNPLGCPPVVPPFTHDELVAEATKLKKVLLKRWRDERMRAAALRTGFITLPFRVPAGAAKVRLWVGKEIGPRALRLTLATRAQVCPPGRCPLLAKVYPLNVRKFAGKRLFFLVSVLVGGDLGVVTSYRSTLRMRGR